MSKYIVGAGSLCQGAVQGTYGTAAATGDLKLINMTSESLNVTVTKGDEGNLLASKTANQRDTTAISVEGGLSTVLRPEFTDWLFEAALGKAGVAHTYDESAGSMEYILADPNEDLPGSTLVVSRGGIIKKYTDLTVRSLTISAAAQDYVKADVDFIGVREDEATSSAINEDSMSFSLPSYRCTHARLLYGNAGNENMYVANNGWNTCQLTGALDSEGKALDVESVNITIDNGIENSPATYCSGLYNGRPIKGLRSVTCEFNIPYSADLDTFKKTYYLAEDAPKVSLMLAFSTNNPEHENITILLPNVSITSAGNNVGGTGIVDASFSGEALSIGDVEPLTITVLSTLYAPEGN